ncbi:MAG: hypothetical protein NC313_02145 [Butyrivibrio sp.]|nr:hypothetical protein [Butyrivibrio sp.]
MENFKVNYKKAYEHISPSSDYIKGIIDKVNDKKRAKKAAHILTARYVMAAGVIVILLFVSVLPAAARTFPAVYNIIEKYAPMLADFVVPIDVESTSRGITMQVEAIDIKDNAAEIIVAFRDAQGSGKDLIKGSIDMYDSYYLQSYGASYDIGGCFFLEYDEQEDKAYFKISLSTDGKYDNGKASFGVRQLLTTAAKEERPIDLSNIIKNPQTKAVSLNGRSGMNDSDAFNKYETEPVDGSPLKGWTVMDITEIDESMIESLTVTGVGYADGILRVQVCRGNFKDADRHARLFLIDSRGEEQCSDVSFMWHEEVNGETVIVNEDWFVVDEGELDKIQMYGVFYAKENSVNGNWKVTFDLEFISE